MPAALFTAPQNAPSTDGSLTWGRTAGLRQQSKPRPGDALAEQAGREAASRCVPSLAGGNGRSGCNDGGRRWFEANANSRTQEKGGLGAL